MKPVFPIALLLALSFPAAAQQLSPSNPFAQPSTLPYHAPPFDRIHSSDYAPALDAGLQEQRADIQRIANDPAAPSFANTLVAMERAGPLLRRTIYAFYAVSGANTDDTLQRLREAFATKYAASRNALYLDPKLFARVRTLYQQRGRLKLDAQSKRLLEYTYQKFILSGANLSESDKATFARLNEEEAQLSARFSNLLVNATKAGSFIISRPEDLEGLSDGEKATYAAAAKARGMEGKWLISLRNTTQQPALGSLRRLPSAGCCV
ncbi:MAG: dipeptidyl carboxypeptidase II, partial [Chitinophagaceae bacterium]